MANFVNLETLCTGKYSSVIDNYVSIKTVDNKEFKVWLVAVDPVSGNLLSVRLGDGKVTSILMLESDYVSDVEVLDDPPQAEVCRGLLDSLFNETKVVQDEDLLKRKSAVISLIKKYRLPVRESEDDVNVIEVGDSLTIHPPYNSESCLSCNEVILKKVSAMLSELVIK